MHYFGKIEEIMYINSDVEQLILNAVSFSLKERYVEVANKLVANKEDSYNVTRKIQRLWEKRKYFIKKGKKEELENWRKVKFEIPNLKETVEKKAPGQPKKKLGDNPSVKTENKIIDGIIQQIEDAACGQAIEPQLLLMKIIERSKIKWKTSEDERKNLPVADSCALIYNINFSLSQYQQLRLYMKDYHIYLPTRNEIDSYKKSLMCDYIVEATKTSCNLEVLVKDTVKSILAVKSCQLLNEDAIHIEGKIGIDGSGSHPKRHQLSENYQEEINSCETNYIGMFWCPLKIKHNDNIVWSNDLPNSTMLSRPLCLVREKESRESVQEHFKPYIESAHSLETTTAIEIGNCKVFLSANTQISMIDGKMADLIQGDSGSFCHYCNTTRIKANDLTCILQGFLICKTVEELTAICDGIEEGSLKYKDSRRAGQCHRPLNISPLLYFAIMHQKIRSLDNCLKLLYHIVSGQTDTWSQTDDDVKIAIRDAKKKVISHIREKCGFLVDSPSANGGNTNTGPVAERFYSPKNRETICSVISCSSDRLAFSELLGYFNKMLTITQQSDSSKVVIPGMVQKLGQDLMVHYKTHFPFAMLTPSIHQMCAHSWELFTMAGGAPIAVYAEQSGEAWNKHIRSFKSGPAARARQCSIRKNTQDIFTRMLVQTHPIIAAKRKLNQCKRCEKYGHTVRSCPLKKQMDLDEERIFIESCYI